MMYVGVDVHKRVCRAAIVDDEGVLVVKFSFINSKKGVEVLVAVESMGDLWVGLYIFSRGMALGLFFRTLLRLGLLPRLGLRRIG